MLVLRSCACLLGFGFRLFFVGVSFVQGLLFRSSVLAVSCTVPPRGSLRVFLGPCDPGRLCVSLMLGPHLGQMGHTAITHFNVHVSRQWSLRFGL